MYGLAFGGRRNLYGTQLDNNQFRCGVKYIRMRNSTGVVYSGSVHCRTRVRSINDILINRYRHGRRQEPYGMMYYYYYYYCIPHHCAFLRFAVASIVTGATVSAVWQRRNASHETNYYSYTPTTIM